MVSSRSCVPWSSRRPLSTYATVSPLFHRMVNPGGRPRPKNAHAVGAVLGVEPPPPFWPLTQLTRGCEGRAAEGGRDGRAVTEASVMNVAR